MRPTQIEMPFFVGVIDVEDKLLDHFEIFLSNFLKLPRNLEPAAVASRLKL